MAGQAQIILWSVALMCLASIKSVGGRVLIAHQQDQEGGTISSSACKAQPDVKTAVYISPPMTARPGQVNNKFWPAEFPKGHIGIKAVNAELVDHNGVPVLLSDVYLHHWGMSEFSVPEENSYRHLHHLLRHMRKHHMFGMHSHATGPGPAMLHRTERPGLLPTNFFGKGAETRKNLYSLPGRYVIESGKQIEGFVTMWTANAHGLDTRGAVDSMGCTECRCHLFNATTNPDGEPLPEGYLGGQWCCEDGHQCAVEEGFNGEEITFHFKYTFEYVDWNECLVPVTEVGEEITDDDDLSKTLLEFMVEGCGDADPSSEECIDTREITLISPMAGEVVNTFSHLHATALNATLWGEDGRLICETKPTYGEGNEAGNEKGYLVGISWCYGNAGTPDAVKVKQGERLKFVVQSTKVGGPHTGLMGFIRVDLVSDGVSAA